jgi:hypothetical protein
MLDLEIIIQLFGIHHCYKVVQFNHINFVIFFFFMNYLTLLINILIFKLNFLLYLILINFNDIENHSLLIYYIE